MKQLFTLASMTYLYKLATAKRCSKFEAFLLPSMLVRFHKRHDYVSSLKLSLVFGLKANLNNSIKGN